MPHPLDLAGRTAIVTGGNRGIGLGYARALVAAGCNVAIWARDPTHNAAAIEQCATGPGDAVAFACDVTDRESIARALAATIDRYDHVDGLFANAGAGGGGRTRFLEQTDNDWDRLIGINLHGARRTIAAVLERMVAQVADGRPGGRIIATSSIAANVGTALNQPYAATKAALGAMIRGIAVEFARHGITANAVLPGYTETEMIEGLRANERFVKAIEGRLPLRRLATADDFGGIAVYLMSGASRYHTGDTIVIDGGYSLA